MGRILTPSSMGASVPFFGRGGARLILGSATFIAPAARLRVHVIGGGGGGASAVVSPAGAILGKACLGGGGGGYAVRDIEVAVGQAITAIVGAGGPGGSVSGWTLAYAGADGGTTSFGDFLSASGGKGGQAPAVAAVGAVGGQGSGGDFNAAGGRGGALPTFMAGCCTGGGAAGSLYGDGGHGGDILPGAGIVKCASGGGAVGGMNAADLTATANYDWSAGASTGGNASAIRARGKRRASELEGYTLFDGAGSSNGDVVKRLQSLPAALAVIRTSLLYPLDGRGGIHSDATSSAAGIELRAENGAGGAGAAIVAANAYFNVHGGALGGGGGLVADFDSASSYSYTAGNGKFGGGGGGCFIAANANPRADGGTGGAGLILVEW